MLQTLAPTEAIALPFPLRLPTDLKLQVTPEQFEALAAVNDVLRLERTAQGELLVNPPTGWETGERNFSITGALFQWYERNGRQGKAFDSSTGFTLPNSAILSPDASWISQERWDGLTDAQKKIFPEVCPDFVIELRSQSDTLKGLQGKMQEYLDNGAGLGWLIDPKNRTVTIYRPNQTPEVLTQPKAVSGDTLMAGFTLDLDRIWGKAEP